MLVQFNTDSHIKGTDELARRVEADIRDTLGHLTEHLTRVEVHLSDVNSGAKGGGTDMRCLLEARPAAQQPVAVSHQAATVADAVAGAIAKLKRALESQFGRRAVR